MYKSEFDRAEEIASAHRNSTSRELQDLARRVEVLERAERERPEITNSEISLPVEYLVSLRDDIREAYELIEPEWRGHDAEKGKLLEALEIHMMALSVKLSTT